MNDIALLSGRKAPSRLLRTPWAHLFVKENFSPREVFSASQLSVGCTYLWGLQYLLGLRTAEPQWYGPDGRTENTTLTKRDRSLAFGTALHAKLESHFRGEPVDWTDEVGQRALVGLHLLPQAPPVHVEQEISLDLTEYGNGIVDPADPLMFTGFKDLCSPPTTDPGKTYDYKSTGNLRWKKTPAQLQADLAANLYLADDMQRYGLRIRDGRWVYFTSTGEPRAEAVDFVILYEETFPIIRAAMIQAMDLRAKIRDHENGLLILNDNEIVTRLPLIAHLPKNLGHCKAYSGCPMHFSAGGPCTAEATPGAAIEQIDYSNVSEPKRITPEPQQTKADQNMATLAERIAANQAAHAAGAAAPPPAAPAASPFGPGVAAPNFNPGASAFPAPGPAPTGFAAGAPAPGPVAAQPPPPVAPTAPVAPFAGFGGVPATPAQNVAQGFGNPPGWTGVNPPEQHQAGAPNPGTPMPPQAPAPGVDVAGQAPTAPPAGKKRGPKPKGTPAAPGMPAIPFAPAPGDDLLTVTIRVVDGSGCAIEIPCPGEWAEMICQHLGPKFNTLES